MALCKYPIHLKGAGGIIPCGQCFTCRLNKSRFWTFRNMVEARLSGDTWWTTLTFAPEFEPQIYIHPKTGQVFEADLRGTLDPSQFERFIKRVRKSSNPIIVPIFLILLCSDPLLILLYLPE